MIKKGKLLDSSVWIEILNQGTLYKSCLKEFNDAEEIIVPSIVLYEVYRKILKSSTEDSALSAIAYISKNKVVGLTSEVALTAADLSIQYKLSMADSVVLAHSLVSDAVFVTLDNDFSAIENARVIRR